MCDGWTVDPMVEPEFVFTMLEQMHNWILFSVHFLSLKFDLSERANKHMCNQKLTLEKKSYIKFLKIYILLHINYFHILSWNYKISASPHLCQSF